MTQQRSLWYFADPMCSWCWGFAPVMSAIRESYREQLRFVLMLGGLRPGTTKPVTEQFRQEILHHWHQVQQRTGQRFDFAGAMPEGFVYDTEPASRAVIVVAELNPEAAFPYLEALQEAFYAQRQDVTRVETLVALAEPYAIAAPQFLERFGSEHAKAETEAHFQRTRRAGIRGFPTLVLQNGPSYAVLTSGYRPFAELGRAIEGWLAATA